MHSISFSCTSGTQTFLVIVRGGHCSSIVHTSPGTKHFRPVHGSQTQQPGSRMRRVTTGPGTSQVSVSQRPLQTLTVFVKRTGLQTVRHTSRSRVSHTGLQTVYGISFVHTSLTGLQTV